MEEEAPDFITVAYGTNDWNRSTRHDFLKNCRAFYQRLSQLYPAAKIFAITPLWRADADRQTPFDAPHHTVGAMIADCCADLKNVTVIDGYRLHPHLTEFFWDGRLHPNDAGFAVYAERLFALIRTALA